MSTAGEPISLDSTVKEMKDYAKKHDIDLGKATKKADIFEVIVVTWRDVTEKEQEPVVKPEPIDYTVIKGGEMSIKDLIDVLQKRRDMWRRITGRGLESIKVTIPDIKIIIK